MLGPDLLKDLEQLDTKVQQNLKEAQDHLKSYEDKKTKVKEYDIDKRVYLKLKVKRISLILGICVKFAPIFYRPFEILTKRGLMEYELDLPTHIKIHIFLHASLLKKYVYDTKHFIDWSLLQVEAEGEFVPKPLHIMGSAMFNSLKMHM